MFDGKIRLQLMPWEKKEIVAEETANNDPNIFKQVITGDVRWIYMMFFTRW